MRNVLFLESPEPPDAGPAGHHWLLAVAAGALFGMVEVLVAWIVFRALF